MKKVCFFIAVFLCYFSAVFPSFAQEEDQPLYILFGILCLFSDEIERGLPTSRNSFWSKIHQTTSLQTITFWGGDLWAMKSRWD